MTDTKGLQNRPAQRTTVRLRVRATCVRKLLFLNSTLSARNRTLDSSLSTRNKEKGEREEEERKKKERCAAFAPLSLSELCPGLFSVFATFFFVRGIKKENSRNKSCCCASASSWIMSCHFFAFTTYTQ